MMTDKQDSWLENICLVAHELKTPIFAAKGFIDLTQNVGPLTEKQSQYLGRAIDSLMRMERQVQLILQAAWVDSGKQLKFEEMNPASVIERDVHQLEPYARQLKVTIHTEIGQGLGLMQANADSLSQVISNLLTNGIKYSKPNVGGEVLIKADGDDEWVTIVVHDDGVGIPAEDLPHIFDRFFRVENGHRKIEGVGLGLYIVRALVAEHSGTVSVDSEVGKGTTFTVRLPRIAHPPSVDEGASAHT
jgi:two-component system phosphate regulon sensor histidine kinase PhoR